MVQIDSTHAKNKLLLNLNHFTILKGFDEIVDKTPFQTELDIVFAVEIITRCRGDFRFMQIF